MVSGMYEQVARVGKAIGHGKRLQLLELIAQAEQSVDEMARSMGIGLTSASAHLQVLKSAGLVLTRRDGTHVYYRLADPGVAGLFVGMKELAARLLPTALVATADPADGACAAVPLVHTIEETREAFMLDVRPAREYSAGHFPGAHSVPLDELTDRMIELPTDQRIIVYCRGEFCRLAREAARTLRDQGLDAYAMDEGVLEWRAGGSVDLDATA
jgi:rhodanese-related sulfurtransferase